MELSKKGQIGTIQSLAPAIIVIMIAGILVVFGVLMLQETRDIDIIDEALSFTVANETGAHVNNTAYTVDEASRPGFGNLAVSTIYNETGEIIDSANYTVDASIGTVIGASARIHNWSDCNISYSYTQGDQTYTATNDTLAGIASFGDFWEMIVLAIVISIVMGLILVMFGRRTTR